MKKTYIPNAIIPVVSGPSLTREEAIKKAAEQHVEADVAFCIDELGWEPNSALRACDL